ncbi:MAG: hypothetical protein D6776_04735 [Planctomycetota bacterium]|nr:MAG: hypothetical protein D6776_04735 [Planctomycetota bacterium]
MPRTTRLPVLALMAALACSSLQPARALVLWGAEHEARAKALAKAVKEKAHELVPDAEPIKTKDKTLTFWGHGGQGSFCDLTPAQFVEVISAYVKKNKKIKTIEIITCDARHKQRRGEDAFINEVVAQIQGDKKLKKRFKKIAIKALPIAVTGKESYSILWASEGTNTFCYIAAKKRKDMDEAGKRMLQLAKTVTPKYHLGEIGNELAKDSERKFSVLYGDIKNLRSYLAKVN